jgi:RHS repeat-associated protein
MAQVSVFNTVTNNHTYTYDNANRLTAVDNQAYTFDDNGNLVSDGQYTYTHTSNKLSSITSSSQTITYTYNGLGDRIQQTVDGIASNYSLDLNTSLTQVLSYGDETYLYGLDRLGYEKAGEDYQYLADALGSVKQVMKTSGENIGLTLAKSYDPYGNVIYSNGSNSMYGFTGEVQDEDLNDMVFLRARYYAPVTGTFLSKDSWEGDDSNPGSYNKWNYVKDNPINSIDPTGLSSTPPEGTCDFANPGLNVVVIESHLHLNKQDELDTYTAAGLAVQCWANNPYVYFQSVLRKGANGAGRGPAQVTNNQLNTPYGAGDAKDGLRCYIYNSVLDDTSNLCECFTKQEIKNIPDFYQNYKLEDPLDPSDWHDAATLMKRRIKHSIDQCKGCRNTDKFIAAALAQNGSGFATLDQDVAVLDVREQTPNYIMRWKNYFTDAQKKNTSDQLSRFQNAISGFVSKGWYSPEIDKSFIRSLINIQHNP